MPEKSMHLLTLCCLLGLRARRGARRTGKLQAGLQLALDGPLRLNDMLSKRSLG